MGSSRIRVLRYRPGLVVGKDVAAFAFFIGPPPISTEQGGWDFSTVAYCHSVIGADPPSASNRANLLQRAPFYDVCTPHRPVGRQVSEQPTFLPSGSPSQD